MINDPCCNAPQVVAGVTQFTPAIPKFYWDVDSQEQGIKQLCKTVCLLIDYLNQVADQVNLDTDAIADLEADFKKFVESGFDDYYREQIEKWIQDNAEPVIKDMMLVGIVPTITPDGYACLNVPETWDDITFDWGMVYGRSDFGCLILQYEVGDGIDNTYMYKAPQPSEQNVVGKLAADMELAMAELYTPLDELVIGGTL